MNLKGKTVLVTGAAKRVGHEIALAFAGRGANLLIHFRSSKKEAEALAKKVRAMGCQARIYRADLLKVRELKTLAAGILQDVRTVDVLVNNASLFHATPFPSVTENDWDDFLGIHVKAPFFLAQAFGAAMKKKGAGRIINIGDWSGLRPGKNYLPYCVSKGALITMTAALAKTLAPEVLVTAVCPGPVVPPADLGRKGRADVAKKTLVGRWGAPKDVAKMAVFLAEQDFVTGSYHLVDGGESLRM
jgi:pteridine reductase